MIAQKSTEVFKRLIFFATILCVLFLFLQNDVQNKAKQRLISNKRFQCNICVLSSSSQKQKVLLSAKQTKTIHLPTEPLAHNVSSAVGLGSDSESAGTVERNVGRAKSVSFRSGVSALEGSLKISDVSLLQQHMSMGRPISSKGTQKIKTVSKCIDGEMKETHLQSRKSVAKKKRGSKTICPEVPGILSSGGPTPTAGKGMESVFVQTLSAISEDISTGMEPPKTRKMMLV